jgi:hypothetical protein
MGWQHTAIITGVGSPLSTPADGDKCPVGDLVSLTVVEQSQGVVPSEHTYDMAAMSQGEVWIYRAVGLEDYCGSLVEAIWPPKCQTWEVGQLE